MENIEPFLINALEQELLKYTAGRTIDCPSCSAILDARTTVVFTVYVTQNGKEQIAKSFVQCAKCWDKLMRIGLDGIKELAAKRPELKTRWEIVDGRQAFGKG
jgi:DNA-directed RNA polymerase subunit RPC12/RpoP